MDVPRDPRYLQLYTATGTPNDNSPAQPRPQTAAALQTNLAFQEVIFKGT